MTSLWIHFLTALDATCDDYTGSTGEIGEAEILTNDAATQTEMPDPPEALEPVDLLDIDNKVSTGGSGDVGNQPEMADLLDLQFSQSTGTGEQDNDLKDVFRTASRTEELTGLSLSPSDWLNKIPEGTPSAVISKNLYDRILIHQQVVKEANEEIGRLLGWMQFTSNSTWSQ